MLMCFASYSKLFTLKILVQELEMSGSTYFRLFWDVFVLKYYRKVTILMSSDVYHFFGVQAEGDSSLSWDAYSIHRSPQTLSPEFPQDLLQETPC